MIYVSVRCTFCNKKMVSIGQIQIIGNGSLAHNLIKESVGGIYQCPRCKRKVDLYVRER